MAGDTGQGMTAKLGTTVIPQITSIEMDNSGDEITEIVADGVLTQVLGSKWRWTVNFVMPTTATHTLEGSLKANQNGAQAGVTGTTKYTAAAGRRSGIRKTHARNGVISCQVRLLCRNEPQLAAGPAHHERRHALVEWLG